MTISPGMDSIKLTPQDFAIVEVSHEGSSSPTVEKKKSRKESQKSPPPERREREPSAKFKDKTLIQNVVKALLGDEAKLRQVAKYPPLLYEIDHFLSSSVVET